MNAPSLLHPRYRSLVLLALLVTGLFFSRALLSLLMVKGILLLLFTDVRKQCFAVFKRPLPLLVLLLLIFYGWLFIREPEWYTLQRALFHFSLLSILCLAVFMTGSTDLLVPGVLVLGILSSLPTLADLLLNRGLAGIYEKGQVAYTLMKGDHQRFSIWISGCLAMAWYAWLQEKRKWALYGILYLSVFLLLFAVRTGWLYLLLVTVTSSIIYLRRQHNPMLSFWVLLVLFVASTAAFNVPSIRKKLQYMQWEWTEKKMAEQLLASDATRRMVNESALKLIKAAPAGYGAAGAKEQLLKETTATYPAQAPRYQWPFNQYFYWWLSAGWVVGSLPVLLLLFGLYRLYTTRNYLSFSWLLFIALTCLYESTLEMQYGFFLAVFFTTVLYLHESGLVKRVGSNEGRE